MSGENSFNSNDLVSQVFDEIDKKHKDLMQRKIEEKVEVRIKYNQRLDDAKKLKEQKEHNLKLSKLENILSTLTYSVPEFKKGEIGKIIMFYDSLENHVSFGTLKYNLNDIEMEIIPEDKDSLRQVFMSYKFAEILGFHKQISKPDNAQRLGGGAYLVLSENEVHIDYHSFGFGSMYKDLVINCLESNGYKLSSLDDNFFNTSNNYLDEIKQMNEYSQNKKEEKEFKFDSKEFFF